MVNNGMRSEALELKRILNEKYELELNYTSSLRIIEALKNSKNNGAKNTQQERIKKILRGDQ